MDPADYRKIEYAKKRLRRNYRGTDLITGSLTAGSYYLVSKFVTGDDFTNIGANKNPQEEIFKATGTTPATWSHGSVLNEIKLQDLRNDADTVFQAATETVTLRTGSFEGGSGSGDITFAKDLLGTALEGLIEEFDPDFVQPAPLNPRRMGIRATVY